MFGTVKSKLCKEIEHFEKAEHFRPLPIADSEILSTFRLFAVYCVNVSEPERDFSPMMRSLIGFRVMCLAQELGLEF